MRLFIVLGVFVFKFFMFFFRWVFCSVCELELNLWVGEILFCIGNLLDVCVFLLVWWGFENDNDDVFVLFWNWWEIFFLLVFVVWNLGKLFLVLFVYEGGKFVVCWGWEFVWWNLGFSGIFILVIKEVGVIGLGISCCCCWGRNCWLNWL